MGDIGEPPMLAILVQAIGTFLPAWIIGVTAAGVTFLIRGGGLYMTKKSNVIVIEVGYVAVMAVIMIVCPGVFWNSGGR